MIDRKDTPLPVGTVVNWFMRSVAAGVVSDPVWQGTATIVGYARNGCYVIELPGKSTVHVFGDLVTPVK